MQQLWTIIFLTLLAIGWGLAAWHDREDEQRYHRRDAAGENREDTRR
jgi:hypothetical protein